MSRWSTHHQWIKPCFCLLFRSESLDPGLPGAVEIGGVSFSQLPLLPSTGHGRAGTTGKRQFEDTLKWFNRQGENILKTYPSCWFQFAMLFWRAIIEKRDYNEESNEATVWYAGWFWTLKSESILPRSCFRKRLRYAEQTKARIHPCTSSTGTEYIHVALQSWDCKSPLLILKGGVQQKVEKG